MTMAWIAEHTRMGSESNIRKLLNRKETTQKYRNLGADPFVQVDIVSSAYGSCLTFFSIFLLDFAKIDFRKQRLEEIIAKARFLPS